MQSVRTLLSGGTISLPHMWRLLTAVTGLPEEFYFLCMRFLLLACPPLGGLPVDDR